MTIIFNKEVARVSCLRLAFQDALEREYCKLVKLYLSNALAISRRLNIELPSPFTDFVELATGQSMDVFYMNLMRSSDLMNSSAKGSALAQTIAAYHLRYVAEAGMVPVLNADGETPYEPLIKLFELGGYFSTSHGFIEVGSAAIPLRRIHPQG